MRNEIAEELEADMERNKILMKQILECENLLDAIDRHKTYGNSYRSLCNYIFKKLGLKFRVEEVECIDGVYTDFDADKVFIEDFKSIVLKRKAKIENHAKKFINSK